MYFTISPYLGDLPDPQQQRGPGPPGLHRHPLLQAHQDTQLWNGERETHYNYAALWGVLKTNDSLYLLFCLKSGFCTQFQAIWH